MSQELEEDPLQSALASAFTQPVTLQSSTASLSNEDASPPIPVPTTLDQSTTSAASDESWKEEYDSRLTEWRAQSAQARAKAEETRAHYEAIRAQEATEAKKSGTKEGGWENVERFDSSSSITQPGRLPLSQTLGTPGNERVSTADARDLVTGEKSSRKPSESSPPSTDHDDESHLRWENIPSLASSFPSLPSHPSPPQGQDAQPLEPDVPTARHRHKQGADDHPPVPSANPKQQPPAVTPLIFSSVVPAKTRALALLSSLAINMFLPFVNGVMLGFGEIFARNVIGPWIGWKTVINPNGTPTLERTRLSSDSRASLRRAEIRKGSADNFQ